MIMPRDPHTNIGDSEHPGGMKTYCSPAGRYDKPLQGQLPADFWKNVEFKSGTSSHGARYAQRTSFSSSYSYFPLPVLLFFPPNVHLISTPYPPTFPVPVTMQDFFA